MKYIALIIAAALLGACATSHQEERVNAVRDFIEVNDLPQAESIRTFDQLNQKELNDYFIIVSSRREHFLIEYSQRCTDDPFTNRPKPDVRRDARYIYPGVDTFRGCRIKAIYGISEDQAQELQMIGEAPGE